MSRLTVGILSVVTASVISGAAQFALGRDLALTPRGAQHTQAGGGQLQSVATAGIESGMVNRASKSDRATGHSGATAPTRTVTRQLEGFSDTSFLFRIPTAGGSSSLSSGKPSARKPLVACEPVVSALTEVARKLPPGSCVA